MLNRTFNDDIISMDKFDLKVQVQNRMVYKII